MADDSGLPSQTLTPLPEDHRIGLIATSFFGAMSFLSTTALFLHLTVRLLQWKFARPPVEPPVERADDVRSLTRDSGGADQFFAPPPVSDEELGLRRRRAKGRTSPNQLLFLVCC